MNYYFLTSNEHKFREAGELFEKHGLKLEWMKESYDEIQGDSLEEVVMAAVKHIGREKVFIEDAGLFIDALKDFPGVYSSYVLKTLGNEGILKLLEGVENRGARFESVVTYKAGEEVKIFKGIVIGNISHSPMGTKGFGYDPIFIPARHNVTFAEDYELKRRISHRSVSMIKLIDYLKEAL
ncbi:MAG: RdgB/HAM1 family non-canonical purine NTP pyrophosphatase [Candidatus Hydrothermarchaeota archaeon]|nr:RdgB/HAM1 family non-canonical purine NTP pyrophosphatase [Candidatus Hydrothermarchaeota archaeon]